MAPRFGVRCSLCMQICDYLANLGVGEPLVKRWHRVLAQSDSSIDLFIGGRRTARKQALVKESLQTRGFLNQSEVFLLMARCTVESIEYAAIFLFIAKMCRSPLVSGAPHVHAF